MDKRLSNLKVTELCSKFEKYELVSSENKLVFVQRLKTAIKSDGLEPERYVFRDETSAVILSSMTNEIISIENKNLD